MVSAGIDSWRDCASLRRENAELRAEVERLKAHANLREIERAEDKYEVERLQRAVDATPTDDRAERALEWVKEHCRSAPSPEVQCVLDCLLYDVWGLRVEAVPASVRFVEVGK